MKWQWTEKWLRLEAPQIFGHALSPHTSDPDGDAACFCWAIETPCGSFGIHQWVPDGTRYQAFEFDEEGDRIPIEPPGDRRGAEAAIELRIRVRRQDAMDAYDRFMGGK